MPLVRRVMFLIDDNTKKLADEVLGLTKLGVTEVWSRIQQAAPELWRLVVRQKAIEGVELAIGAILGLIGLLFVLYIGLKWLKKSSEHDNDGPLAFLILGVSGTGTAFVACLINAIDLLGNPSYWALKDILDMVRR